MKKCYCPSCGKEVCRLQPPCKSLQVCEKCGKSLMVVMRGDDVQVKTKTRAGGKDKENI